MSIEYQKYFIVTAIFSGYPCFLVTLLFRCKPVGCDFLFSDRMIYFLMYYSNISIRKWNSSQSYVEALYCCLNFTEQTVPNLKSVIKYNSLYAKVTKQINILCLLLFICIFPFKKAHF